MPILKKVYAIALILGISSLYAQPTGIQVGEDAPSFTIYQYKDMTFDTDTVYGKKILTLIFGSIT